MIMIMMMDLKEGHESIGPRPPQNEPPSRKVWMRVPSPTPTRSGSVTVLFDLCVLPLLNDSIE